MLAGKMKLNHFLLIVAAVVAAGGTGLYFACRGGDDDFGPIIDTEPDELARQQDVPAPGPVEPRPPDTRPDTTVAQPVADQPTPPTSGRAVDREVMAWVGKDLGKEKIKDALKGRAYKVNLYQDAGKGAVNRAKIDLDRDDKWDEKWTFDGANISRKVAPADDENYTESYDWNGSDWVKR